MNSPASQTGPDDLARGLIALSAALGLALVVYGVEGRVLRETESAALLLRADAEEDRLRAAARRLAVAVMRRGLRGRTPVRTELVTVAGRYDLRAGRAPMDLGDCAAVVSFTMQAAPPLTDIGLKVVAHLTDREVEVARLMGRGMSNASIARSLAISHHTAERHSERVLRKLRLRSRAAVAAHLNPSTA